MDEKPVVVMVLKPEEQTNKSRAIPTRATALNSHLISALLAEEGHRVLKHS